MKRGYKHKTGVFGSDSEKYASRLFLMLKNPNGDRRPDLVSLNGRYKPRLSIELKSGRNKKGVLVASQLHYAVTTEQDYRDLFGEDLPTRRDLLPGADWNTIAPILPKEQVAYYYALINREDKLTSEDLDGPWSTVRIKWGDIYIVPHEFGFYQFAVDRAMRTGEKVDEVVKNLVELIRADVQDQCSHYKERNSDRQSWQDLHGRDIMAVFNKDGKVATVEGRKRVALLYRHYDQLRDLRRIEIPGPNDTSIYVLAEPEHHELFDKQLRKTVEERKPTIERVAKERLNAEKLIQGTQHDSNLFYPEEPISPNGKRPSEKEVIKLNRLKEWLARGESIISIDGEETIDEEIDTSSVPF